MSVTAAWRYLILAAGLIGLGLAGVYWLLPPKNPPFQAEPVKTPVEPVDWQGCDFEAPTGVHVRCGWFETGEETDGGEPIRLRLLMLRRTAEPPHAPVTIHLPGGPGAPAGTGRETAGEWAAWMLRHDVPGRLLLFDPRGTGASQPTLDCPGRVLATRHRLAQRPMNSDPMAANHRRLERCRARLVDSGLDPADFTAHRMLVDVPRMMQAIDVYRARLLGLSHGSRIALALLRQSPDRFSRAVLDGVFPTHRDPFAGQAELAADARSRLSPECRGTTAGCNASGSSTAFHILKSRVRRSPPLLHVPQPDGLTQPLWLTDRRLADLVFAAQSFGATAGVMRRALQEAVVGDYSPLAELFSGPLAIAVREGRHEPVYWESLCSEAGLASKNRMAESHPCRSGWGQPALPDTFRLPVSTDHAVLLLAGERDPVTPPAWAREQKAHMPSGHLLIGKGSAHGTLFAGDCVARAVAGFLRDLDRDLPEECAPASASELDGSHGPD